MLQDSIDTVLRDEGYFILTIGVEAINELVYKINNSVDETHVAIIEQNQGDTEFNVRIFNIDAGTQYTFPLKWVHTIDHNIEFEKSYTKYMVCTGQALSFILSYFNHKNGTTFTADIHMNSAGAFRSVNITQHNPLIYGDRPKTLMCSLQSNDPCVRTNENT